MNPPNLNHKFSLEFVLEATQGRLLAGENTTFSSVVIDSRQAVKNSLFFAIAGQVHNGHDFLSQAVAQGATGVVIERGQNCHWKGFGTNIAVIEVASTVASLGYLAKQHCLRLAPHLQIIGITGSHGKTTCKDMVFSILQVAFSEEQVLATEGNLNNHLGVPLTLLRLTYTHRYAVIEMGMSALGEVEYLAQLCVPQIGIITCIAPVHLEGLGTIENIARAKSELFQGLSSSGVMIHPEEPLLDEHLKTAMKGSHRQNVCIKRVDEFSKNNSNSQVVECIGLKNPHQIQIKWPANIFNTKADGQFYLSLPGTHNEMNAALAATVAYTLNVPLAAIQQGLSSVQSGKHRWQKLEIKGRTFIDDCYNAAPRSMHAALRTLVQVAQPSQRTIAVLGDMFELGPDEVKFHCEVGEYVAQEKVSCLLTVGNLAKNITETALSHGVKAVHVDKKELAVAWLQEHTLEGDLILLKASRGMKLEEILALF